MLPTTKEVNDLLPHYQAIQLKIAEWRARDSNENAWLYDGASSDLSNAWKWIYRMGVRHQVLHPGDTRPGEEVARHRKAMSDLLEVEAKGRRLEKERRESEGQE